MSPRSYILALVLCSAALALCVVVFNYFTDPYGITHAARIPGFNQYKADINDRVRLLKKYQPLRGEFNAVIAGNSRVEMGLDPAHRCFGVAGLTPYNAGVPGAGLRRQLEFALNVIHAQPVRRVIIGLDFADFISADPSPVANRVDLREIDDSDFKFLPSGTESPSFPETAALDYYQALFSLDALASSLKTVAMQGQAAPDRDHAGFNPARDMAEAVRVEGPRALFQQKLESLATSYARPRLLFAAGESANAQLLDIADFLDLARDMAVQVDLFIGPSHRLYWELLEGEGLLPDYARWRDAVIRIARTRAQSQAVSLWDFARVSPYIDEPVPPAGVRSGPLQWFWEPVHYRSELGDLVLDTILGDVCRSEATIGEDLLQTRR
jgi:hypothetical protein